MKTSFEPRHEAKLAEQSDRFQAGKGTRASNASQYEFSHFAAVRRDGSRQGKAVACNPPR